MATFLILLAILGVSAQKEIKTDSKATKVIVYRSGAQIFRKADVNIPAGTSQIIISGLSSQLNPNSLRISGKGAFVILEQQSEVKYPEPEETKESQIPAHIINKIKAYGDSLELLQYEIDENNQKRDLLNVEKNLIQNSKAISATDTISELKEALLFYRTRMAEINAEALKIKKKEKILTRIQQGYQAKLAELNDYKTKTDPNPNQRIKKPESVVTITISAESAVPNATLFLSYLAPSASWMPQYELKVDEVSKPVQLSMKALVTQNTDEDWNKVNLTLSTGTPMVNKTIPVIYPWVLTYYQNIYKSNAANSANNFAMPASVEKKEADKEFVRGARTDGQVTYIDGVKMKSSESQAADNYVEQTNSIMNTEYEITLPYEIPSDGKPHTISILKENLTGIYKHVSVPKLDKETYLTAALVGWEKLNLIPASANIIFENSIIGQTFIDPSTSNDTLTVSLGADKRIFIDRKKLSDKTKDKIVGNNRKRQITIEITVKNQNITPVTLNLKDQFPVSNITDIKIETSSVNGANVDPNSGIIEWNLTLKPNEIQKLSFTYEISWDKTKPLLTE